jgi:hypothetical protein
MNAKTTAQTRDVHTVAGPPGLLAAMDKLQTITSIAAAAALAAFPVAASAPRGSRGTSRPLARPISGSSLQTGSTLTSRTLDRGLSPDFLPLVELVAPAR